MMYIIPMCVIYRRCLLWFCLNNKRLSIRFRGSFWRQSSKYPKVPLQSQAGGSLTLAVVLACVGDFFRSTRPTGVH